MGMKLRRDVAVYRPGSVVLEFGGDEFGRGFWCVAAADARLCVVFELHNPSETLPKPLAAFRLER
jgi:hypothetical protein